jgi:hypothetical protein
MRSAVDYRDRSPLLVGIGIISMLIGVTAAFFGPLETYCFYLFSEGGRFHYEGFGFGSFMFGNIACQIIGYYLIAMVLVPLGYGHLKRHRWVRTLSLILLWSWLVVGIPLVVVVLFTAATAKDLSLAAALIMAIFLGLSYLVIPGVLIRFYGSRDVRLTLEARHSTTYGFERLPMPVLVLSFLHLFYVVVLHMPLFFNGIFPFFGVFLSGMQGILLLDISVMCLVGLTWGALRLRIWAWWGSLAYWIAMTSSALLTFARSSYMDILSVVQFAPTEMEFLDGLPFQGVHFAMFVGIPLFATLGVILLSRRHFGVADQVPSQ